MLAALTRHALLTLPTTLAKYFKYFKCNTRHALFTLLTTLAK